MKRATVSAAVVLLTVGLATGLTETTFALGADLPFEWYVAAVACVAWWCGRTPALAAAVLASAIADFAFLPFHQFSFGMGLADSGRLLVFVGVALLIAHLVAGRRLAEEERARREKLLATVAHELNNMIVALRMWTHALQRERLPGERLDQAARGLARTAAAISKLAADLMDWSRIAFGRLDLESEDVDLADVVQDAIEEMKGQAEELGVKLSWSLASTHVRADRDRLHQVALNLLANSLKATRQGGEVAVSVGSADHRAVFTVRDTGRGIPPHLLQRVFDLGNLRSESSGLGLGLAVSRDIVRAQGGDVTAHSRGVGSGATFAVNLPAARGVERVSAAGAAS